MNRTSVPCWVALVVAVVLLGSPVLAVISERIPDQDGTATSVLDDNGTVWVGTPTGAYRIDGDSATRIPDFKMDVTGIYHAGGSVWLATTQGAYRIDGDKATRIPSHGLVVTSVAEVGGRVWLAATTGAYLVKGDDAVRTPDRDFDVASIVDVDGLPWLATGRGAFRLTAKGNTFEAQHVVDLDYDLNQIIEIDGRAWLATDRGAFRIDPSGPKHIELITPSNPTLRYTGLASEVYRIIPVAGRIWFIGESGPFRVDGDVAYRMPDERLDVANVVEAGGHAWLATGTGAYRIDGDTPRRIPDLPLKVASISQVDKRVWLATSTGAYEVDGDKAVRIPDEPLSVSSVSEVGAQTFLATSTGAYVVEGDRATPIIDTDVGVLSARTAGGYAWLATSQGSFRVNPDRAIRIRLTPRDTGWRAFLRRLLPHGISLAGNYGLKVSYIQRLSLDELDAPEARAIAATKPDDFRKLLSARQFSVPSTIEVAVPAGSATVRVAVKDGWSPPAEQEFRFLAIPVWLAVAALAGVVWLASLAVVFALSPVSQACHRLIMRPALRNVGSLGLIPLLLALVPPMRRHLLRRYRRHLEDGLGPEPPADPEPDYGHVQERLVSDHLATASRPADVEPFVTACDVARAALKQTHGLTRLAKVTPMPLLASGDEIRHLDDLAVNLLKDYGAITDAGLARWLLGRGGFLLIVERDSTDPIDGHPEDIFIARNRSHSYLCLVAETVVA